MIDLSEPRDVLLSAEELLERLNGLDITDDHAIERQGDSKPRTRRAQASKDLLRLADQLELSAKLVRNAYWIFRGEDDPRDEEAS